VWQVWHLWHWAGSGGRLVVAVVAAAVCVASVVLGGIGLHFAWQAWHLATSACTLCGKRGTYGNGLALVVPVCRRGRRGYWCGRRGLVTSTFTLGGSRHRPALCVAGVALPVCRRGRRGCLCGRRGTWRHRPSLCVAGVALGDIRPVAGVALGNIELHRWRGTYGRRSETLCVR